MTMTIFILTAPSNSYRKMSLIGTINSITKSNLDQVLGIGRGLCDTLPQCQNIGVGQTIMMSY